MCAIAVLVRKTGERLRNRPVGAKGIWRRVDDRATKALIK